MPAHTYMRTGNYAGALKANAIAADVDRKYIAAAGPDGFYPTMYYNHNLDFLASAAMMTGQFARASQAADELVKNVAPIIASMPMVEPFGAKKMYVLLRFARWDEALQLPMPDAKATVLTALFHFGRGVAHAALGALADAGRDRAAFQAAKQLVPSDAMIGYNPAAAVFWVCDAVLEARLAAAGNNLDGAIRAWEKAVAAEDALSYDEPADWFYPTRESLGAAYFRARRFQDADRTFREDLERNPGNPRSLFAVWQMVGVTSEPDDPMTLLLRRRFRDAWTDADVELKLSDF
jgi:tetratricopeptide (TPR) repeat protein